MKKKIFGSLATIAAVAALAIGATGAFFSDTETSVDNKFEAGAIDLRIDNESYVDQGEGLEWRDDLSWGENGGADGTAVGKFFDIIDLKPGDNGEDTISIHLDSNPAWVCVDLDITANSDETCTEPENEAENDECDPAGEGDLPKDLNFAFWMDDGDNVFESDEQLLTEGPVSNVLGGMTWALFDSQTGTMSPMAPTTGGEPKYIGKAWCYGTLTMTGVPQSDYENPSDEFKGYTCDGSMVGNEGQTDLLMGNITFRAVQSRHNESYVCTRPDQEEPTTNVLRLENETEVEGEDWEVIVDGKYVDMTYNLSGPTFDYSLEGHGMAASTDYALIYYADGWPGNHPGAKIGLHTTDASGNLSVPTTSKELGMDLPHSSDANYSTGAKIWMIPSSAYDASTNSVTVWPPDFSTWFFEGNVYIQYDDTDV